MRDLLVNLGRCERLLFVGKQDRIIALHCSLNRRTLFLAVAPRQGGRVINAKGPMQNVAPSRKPRLTCPGHVRIQNIPAGRLLFPVLFACILPACRSTKPRQSPTIELSKIPPAAQGGRERVDTISGRVTGAHPGQRIVVYARSGPWWVQPWPDKPFIPIQADSTGTHAWPGDFSTLVLRDCQREKPAEKRK